MLAVAEDELALPPGKALRLAESLVGEDEELPTVDEVRATYPDPVHVGSTADGKPVTLRSLVAPDQDDDDEPAKAAKPPAKGKDKPAEDKPDESEPEPDKPDEPATDEPDDGEPRPEQQPA